MIRCRLPLSICALFLVLILAAAAAQPPAGPPPASVETQQCLDCHRLETPGLVQDWLAGRHAYTIPSEALKRPAQERRICASALPAGLADVTVGCYECHGLNPERHADNVEHFGLRINLIVTPADCATCHPQELEQYGRSTMGLAHGNLVDNPVYMALVDSIDGIKTAQDGRLATQAASEQTKAENCLACHGTRVEVLGHTTVQTDYGEMELPQLSGWPNHGVGRINPDGSIGLCSACHPRHSFSISVARQPHTCGQCHLEPDVPAFNIYSESKHGNIYSSLKESWDFDAVPWSVGADFKAPTCAACHASALSTPDGAVAVERTHDLSGRVWTRLFGLVYAHPQPISGDTSVIRNADGLPLPTTFDNRPAEGFLISADEAAARRSQMTGLCGLCHGSSHTTGHFVRLDNTISETNAMVAAATELMAYAWERKLADNSNPFDESLEAQWISQWLFYANSVRYASAMSGPDYAGFKNGWWYLSKNLRDMEKAIKTNRCR